MGVSVEILTKQIRVADDAHLNTLQAAPAVLCCLFDIPHLHRHLQVGEVPNVLRATKQSYDIISGLTRSIAKGTRGQFFQAGARVNLPVYLDAEVQAYLSARALARGVDMGQLVNELLRKDIELIEAAR